MEKLYAHQYMSKEQLNEDSIDVRRESKQYLKRYMLDYLEPSVNFKYNIYEDEISGGKFNTLLKLILYYGNNLPKFCEGEVISPNLDVMTLDLLNLENREYRVMDVWEDNYLLVEEELFDNHLRESQYFRIGRDFVENNFIGSE